MNSNNGNWIIETDNLLLSGVGYSYQDINNNITTDE